MARRIVRPVAVSPKTEEEHKNDNVENTLSFATDDDKHETQTAQEARNEVEDNLVQTEEKKTPEEIQAENEVKWGKGFTKDEYEILNSKLEQFRMHYPLRTAMHQEALITYLKYAQRRDKAIETGDSDDADKWGKLASRQAQDAKINPSQLSIADLSDGINNFGKVVEFVEKHEDIIPLLPQFVRNPRDEIDYEIWQFINYNQRVMNVPESTYAEIYAFVDEKYKAHKKEYDFLVREENKHYKEPV